MKLGIGTVQFGLNYGINNKTGKPDGREVREIIELAARNGLNLLDTAADYGDSENIIGDIVGDGADFAIVTKVSRQSTPSKSLHESLKRLKRKNVYGLLIHDFDQFLSNGQIASELQTVRDDGLVEKIGFSLYLPDQLEILLDKDVDFELIQVPYSILDQRFEPYFSLLKARGVEIHVRSVYVQGLVFMKTASMKSFFEPVKAKIERLHSLSNDSRKSVQSLCLNFAIINEQIDKVLVGVENVAMLEDNIKCLDMNLSVDQLSELRSLKETDERMILPYMWE